MLSFCLTVFSCCNILIGIISAIDLCCSSSVKTQLEPWLSTPVFNDSKSNKSSNDLRSGVVKFTSSTDLKPSLSRPVLNDSKFNKSSNDLRSGVVNFTNSTDLKPSLSRPVLNDSKSNEGSNDLRSGVVNFTNSTDLRASLFRPVFNDSKSNEGSNDLLSDVVKFTDLTNLEQPRLDGIVGRRGVVPELPAIPDTYIGRDGVRVPRTDRDYSAIYANRFRPHIAVELRYDITHSMAALVADCTQHGWDFKKGIRAFDEEQNSSCGSYQIELNPTSATWSRQTPFNYEVMRLCVPAKTVDPVRRGRRCDTFTDTNYTYISVFQKEKKQNLGQKEGNASDDKRSRTPLYSGPFPVDGDVRLAAREGIKAVLYKGDIVVLLVPLANFAEAWCEMEGGAHARGAAAAAQTAAEAVLQALPLEWRQLGCVPQLALVVDVFLRENVAKLLVHPPITPADYDGPDLTSFRAHAQPARRGGPFYAKKLSVIGAAQLELDALTWLSRTRFADTLYDPQQSAVRSVQYVADVENSTEHTDDVLLHQELNHWQLCAVHGVLRAAYPAWYRRRGCASSPISAPDIVLIEGPPGTGKTQTIATSILNLLHLGQPGTLSHARVLVCAPSNCAVDEVLLRMRRLLDKRGDSGLSGAVPLDTLARWKLVRIGVRDKIDPAVLQLQPPVYLDDVVSAEMELRGVEKAEQAGQWELRKMIERETVEAASVVFSTLGSLHRVRKIAPLVEFAAVIVDEASQCTEPAVLQALRVASAGSAVVLVGDSKQLQPTILSPESSRRGLRRSLLVRLLVCGHASFLLRTQYRMHPDIVAFPNAYFYDSQLETDGSVVRRQDVAAAAAGGEGAQTVAQRLGRCPRFVMRDVAQGAMKMGAGRSLSNSAEAAAVVQYMRKLRTSLRLSVREMGSQLGIITFYNAQKDVIVSMLTREERQSGLQVASVDSFQGKEKRIILLSCVRTVQRGGSGGAGFLAQWNRLNVALTRAQDLCVVFCSCRWVRSLGKGAPDTVEPVTGARRALTTADSTPEEVMRQLDAHDTDPLALYRMLQHAERMNSTQKR